MADSLAVPREDSQRQLTEERTAFRTRMEQAGAWSVWEKFRGRVAVVLSGGGTRGAYQAGALLAFQDGRVPTHILTASSVGCFNAAGYAAFSGSLVGNADLLVEVWRNVTPQDMGIEWTRYAWVLVGLIAAAAGFGNLLRDFLVARGYRVQLAAPELTWFFLALAGIAVLLLYDRLPYVGYCLASRLRGRSFIPDARKAALSLLANLLVWSFLAVVLYSLHIPTRTARMIGREPLVVAVLIILSVLLVALNRLWRAPLSNLVHRLLRLPLRPGLFANFERAQFLHRHGTDAQLRASPMRVIFTATDLEAGVVRYYSNVAPDKLSADPGTDPGFIGQEVTCPESLISAMVASSALPIAYEPVRFEGRLLADGGLCANQPIRPAVRLGADVLFVMMMDSPGGTRRGGMDTFLDVGLRALDVLLLQNLLADLRVSANLNSACEQAAAELGLRPEEVELILGTRHYRYVKAFAICPPESLPGRTLEFSAEAVNAAILQGYRDACGQVLNFLSYAREARFGLPRRTLHWGLQIPPM